MSDKPTYIYKLVPYTAPVPDELPERLPVSDIDQNSGFIHLSTAPQVPNTLKFFFGNDPKVYILRLSYEPLEKNIRWEDPKAEVCGPRGGEGMFPHLYNGLKLGKDEIESVQTWEKGDGGWDEALKKAESWLVY
ncbi:uncharacterized protein FOMMEDRAFT_22754 [Fomitiporia mediterranea MF3/22]|uniref:uncharacterized protein n=1 Tax=Fomitiporia mediterranea (strain MF3/22) TaxID=694068 RepID=UPI000440904B|nr:uncharacterized protein FOMMEDRAFT_22754 [Fomitiporia mediterranea MF3/22]EJC99614.1 hypothetical protein FOMMEDRAFT_22754 [Fomitiporia mediterranea MF3/22]